LQVRNSAKTGSFYVVGNVEKGLG